MKLLKSSNLCVSYKNRNVLKNVTFEINAGERWAVLGKNGAGKSTLIKSIAALIKPISGTVEINGKSIFEYASKERAKLVAYVPQKEDAVVPYTVYDFAMLGRYSAMGLWAVPDFTDKKAVLEALEFCNVQNLKNRMMTTLSGGEYQRVMLAGALAQESPLLLLDEPTTFLDPAHERLFLKALETAQKEKELTTVMVTHDINTALSSCSHILSIVEGKVFFVGSVEEFRTQCPEMLKNIYGISFECWENNKLPEIYGTWGKD